MTGVIIRCPRCIPPTVRRLDGSRIAGFEPEALYVGYRHVPRLFRAARPPRECPNCGSTLVQVPEEVLPNERPEGIR